MSEAAERTKAPAHEPGLAAANERLLVRLGFDLHDGPLQQVHALAQDLRLLREQVLTLTGSEYREPLVGRFGDLEAQLTELHQDLRDLAHSLEPRSLLQQPLPRAVARELKTLSRRTGIATTVERVENDDGVCMEIRDDGHGFDPDAVVPDARGQSGIGVVGMRERLRLLGGRLELESARGGPTGVRAVLPRWES